MGGAVDRGFRLDGGGETLVFLISGGAPELVYWGPGLGEANAVVEMDRLFDRAVAVSQVDGAQKLSWLPQAGEGFSGWPGLQAHRDGEAVVTQLRLEEAHLDAASARIRLVDQAAGVEVTLSLDLDPSNGVLAGRTELVNTADPPLTVDWLAAGALPSEHGEAMLMDGRWGREFIPVRQSLATGLVLKENRTGRTSHHAAPFMLVGEAGFSERHGEVFAAHLAWSGNHRLIAERLRDGRVQVQAGELLDPGEIILGAGERYRTPTLYLARSGAGLRGISDRLHPFARRMILGGRLEGKLRPVHYNTWEAIYFDHDPSKLDRLVDLAAAAGVERFVLDDGWFKGRTSDRAGLGDWTPDPARYPHGLAPLIARVRAAGMQFGLWVEPEMANADSDLLRAHPDWILGDPARDQPLGRRQYVLDLTRQEVWAAIYDQLNALLAAQDIEYLKWDMNRDLAHGISGGRPAVHRQTLAVYALLDALRGAHPGVEIESCASGGGRADYEVLRRTDRIWTSDCNDPIERQAIQRGFSLLFPPEIMGAHIGPRASETTARTSSLRLRALTAMTGHLGVEADLTAMSDAERTDLAEAIALHKEMRPWLHAGRTLRLDHPDPGCVALAVVARDHAFVSAAQCQTPATATLAPLRIDGLDPDSVYDIRPLYPPRRPRPSVRGTPFLSRGESADAAGAILAQAGLPLPVLRAGEAAAFVLTRRPR